MKRFTRKAATALGISVGPSTMLWKDGAAAYAARHGVQTMHMAGLANGKPAYFGEDRDTYDKVDENTMLVNADFVMGGSQERLALGGFRGKVLPEEMLDRREADGLCDETVHACGEGALSIFVEGIGCHGDDGGRVQPRSFSRARMRPVAASPSRFGICQSMKMMSNAPPRRFLTRSTASRPSSAISISAPNEEMISEATIWLSSSFDQQHMPRERQPLRHRVSCSL